MHNFLKRLVIVLFVFGCLSCFGQTTQTVFLPVGGYYDFPVLTTATHTTVLDLRKSLVKTHTIEISLTGTPSVCTYRVEGSSNSTNWYDISGTQSCLTNNMFHITDKPIRYIRINVLSLTGTASLTYQWTGL
jgi:hypothetical protein